MNAVRFIIRSILYIPFIILRAIAQGLWSVIHGILTSVGRWIGRVVLPIVGLGGVLWFVANSMPPEQRDQIIAQIGGIAIIGYIIWNMISSPFKNRAKKRRRR